MRPADRSACLRVRRAPQATAARAGRSGPPTCGRGSCREKRRQDWVCGFELGMSRIAWPELLGAERARLKVRLRREYDATTARYGTNIDDLAPYIVRRPRTA